MVSEIERKHDMDSIHTGAEVWIPEFGVFDTMYLEPNQKYQGRLYRISSDTVRTISEILGFTARFDSATVRSAFIDVVKTEGHAAFEIDRNTKPTDLGLRYSRDRWTSLEGPKGDDRMRPWLTTFYEARFIPEKTLAVLAEQLRIKPESVSQFYVRVNLKERIAGLIVADEFIEEFPSGPFSVFALPEGQIAVIPVTEIASQTNGQTQAVSPARQYQNVNSEPAVKYATYSKSEIDFMLKQNAENISNALSGKISSLQKLLQESAVTQEKTFNKIAEKFGSQVEDARTKIDITTKSAQESTKKELTHFGGQLQKELEQFRAQINKNVLPIAKTFDEKVKALEEVTERGSSNLQPMIMKTAVAILIALAVATVLVIAITLPHLSQIASLRSDVQKMQEQINRVHQRLNKPTNQIGDPASTAK